MATRVVVAGAVYARMDRQEAISVPEDYQGHVYYHGTSNEDIAKKILQSGELRPGREWGHGDPDDAWTSAPIEGQVYFTPNLKYVLSYILGAHESCPPDVLCKRGGRYGYLFVVPGSAFTDLLPDEDTIGELLCNEDIPWLTREFQRLADIYWQELQHIFYQLAKSEYEGYIEEDAWEEEVMGPLPSWEEYWEDYDLHERMMDCSYPEIPIIGKFFLKHADEEDVERLFGELEQFNAVSHYGAVPFTEAWRFDKQRVRELNPDGSNFFDLAEKIV